MKIPGLDDALSKLDTLNEEMIPLLHRIAEGVDALVRLEEEKSAYNGIIDYNQE